MFICVCIFVFVRKSVFVCFNMSVRIYVCNCVYACVVCVFCAYLGVLVFIIVYVYVCLG